MGVSARFLLPTSVVPLELVHTADGRSARALSTTTGASHVASGWYREGDARGERDSGRNGCRAHLGKVAEARRSGVSCVSHAGS